MAFSINKIIFQTAKDLDVSKNTVEEFISGELGTRWILERSLNCSEVELSMLLKTIRKRLSYDFSYTFVPNLNKRKRAELIKKLFHRYQKFDTLHYRFFKGQNYYLKIKKMLLPETIILDSGIGTERFFRLLPQVLRKISPDELDLCFAINTLLRWHIALFLQSQIQEDLYARGSLIFFNARSFGCGYLANFPQEAKDSESAPSYFPLQGSDLDLRIKKNTSSVDTDKKIAKHADEIKHQLTKFKTFLTIEVTNFDKTSGDDLWAVRDFSTLKRLLPRFSSKGINLKKKSSLAKKKKIPIGELKEKNFLRLNKLNLLNTKGKVRLTEDNIEKLKVAFQKILQYYKTNEDFIAAYSAKWRSLLEKAKRETDFYGFISKKELFLVFKNLFFLSGCRFLEKEERELFNQVLRGYDKTRI